LKKKYKKNRRGSPIISNVFSIVSREDEGIKEKLETLYNRACRRVHPDKTADREKSKEILE